MPKNTQLLLVDDDELTLYIHRKILSRCQVPFDVHSFRSAENALKHMNEDESGSAFLVLLDINMPGMSGWDLLGKVESSLEKKEIYVIMATSSVDYDDRKKAEGYDCVIDFIEKPFTMDTCKQIIALPQLA